MEVTFTNKSQNATDYEWSFGDKKDGSSIMENPVYTTGSTFLYHVVEIRYQFFSTIRFLIIGNRIITPTSYKQCCSKNPVYTYEATGTYKVTLTAIDAKGNYKSTEKEVELSVAAVFIPVIPPSNVTSSRHGMSFQSSNLLSIVMLTMVEKNW